jgi:outer membrane protein OmpA-like peptidoglycan-associated protein
MFERQQASAEEHAPRPATQMARPNQPLAGTGAGGRPNQAFANYLQATLRAFAERQQQQQPQQQQQEQPQHQQPSDQRQQSPSQRHQQPEVRWAAQLQMLRDMGFSDDRANVAALQQTQGDIDAAVAILAPL